MIDGSSLWAQFFYKKYLNKDRYKIYMTLEDDIDNIRIEATSGYIEDSHVVYYHNILKDPTIYLIMSLASLSGLGISYLLSEYIF